MIASLLIQKIMMIIGFGGCVLVILIATIHSIYISYSTKKKEKLEKDELMKIVTDARNSVGSSLGLEKNHRGMMV